MVPRIPDGRFAQSGGVDNIARAEFLFEFDLLVSTVDQTDTERGEQRFIVGTIEQQSSELGHVFVGCRVQQCFFGREIVEQSSARNTNLGGDVRHRRVFVAELFKKPPRAANDVVRGRFGFSAKRGCHFAGRDIAHGHIVARFDTFMH